MSNTNKRAIKAKDAERLRVLQAMHPGDLTPELQKEMEKLQSLRAKFGDK